MTFRSNGYDCDIRTLYPHRNANQAYWVKDGRWFTKTYDLDVPFSAIKADVINMLK